MQDKNKDEYIDLREVCGILLSKIWTILICGVAAGAVFFAMTEFAIAPKYESTTSIYVMSKQDGSTYSYNDTLLSSQLTKDYEELIGSRYVLEGVIEQLALTDDYESLSKRVSVESASDTRIIYITVKDESPAMAQSIANEIRELASEHIKAVTNVEAVNVADEANLPENPSEPSVMKLTLIGILLGLFISSAIIVIRHLMDDTIKTSEDVEKYLGWGTLASIPVIGETDGRRRVSRRG